MILTTEGQFLARGVYNITCTGGDAAIEFKTEDMPSYQIPITDGTLADGDNHTINMPECLVRMAVVGGSPVFTINLVSRSAN